MFTLYKKELANFFSSLIGYLTIIVFLVLSGLMLWVFRSGFNILDYGSGASSNKEIVTPENLMRSIFAESMLPMIQAIVSGDNSVVSAIGDLANRPINLNGRKVSENIFNDLQGVALRKGKTILAR